MVGYPAEHEHTSDLVSSVWGSYFYYPEKKKVRCVINIVYNIITLINMSCIYNYVR